MIITSLHVILIMRPRVIFTSVAMVPVVPINLCVETGNKKHKRVTIYYLHPLSSQGILFEDMAIHTNVVD